MSKKEKKAKKKKEKNADQSTGASTDSSKNVRQEEGVFGNHSATSHDSEMRPHENDDEGSAEFQPGQAGTQEKEEWTDGDNLELCSKMRQILEKESKNPEKLVQTSSIRWPRVEIVGKSHGRCSKQWTLLSKLALKYMSPMLVLQNVEKCLQHWQQVMELEKIERNRPTSAYNRFVRDYIKEHKDDFGSTRDLMSNVGHAWQELDPATKEQYQKRYNKEKAAYLLKTRGNKFDRKRLKPVDFYRQSKIEKERKKHPEMSHFKLHNLMAEKYRHLSDDVKLKYILQAVENDKDYMEAYEAFCKDHTDIAKPPYLLTKDDQRIYDEHRGIPSKPPGYLHGFALFLHERKVENQADSPADIRKAWVQLSTVEKEDYTYRSKELRKTYMEQVRKYASKLPPAEQQDFLHTHSISEDMGTKHVKERSSKRRRSVSETGKEKDVKEKEVKVSEKFVENFYIERDVEYFKRRISPLEISQNQQTMIRRRAREKFKNLNKAEKAEVKAKARARYLVLQGGPKKPAAPVYMYYEKQKKKNPDISFKTATKQWHTEREDKKKKIQDKYGELVKQYNEDVANYIESLSSEDKRKLAVLHSDSETEMSTPLMGTSVMNTEHESSSDADSDSAEKTHRNVLSSIKKEVDDDLGVENEAAPDSHGNKTVGHPSHYTVSGPKAEEKNVDSDSSSSDETSSDDENVIAPSQISRDSSSSIPSVMKSPFSSVQPSGSSTVNALSSTGLKHKTNIKNETRAETMADRSVSKAKSSSESSDSSEDSSDSEAGAKGKKEAVKSPEKQSVSGIQKKVAAQESDSDSSSSSDSEPELLHVSQSKQIPSPRVSQSKQTTAMSSDSSSSSSDDSDESTGNTNIQKKTADTNARKSSSGSSSSSDSDNDAADGKTTTPSGRSSFSEVFTRLKPNTDKTSVKLDGQTQQKTKVNFSNSEKKRKHDSSSSSDGTDSDSDKNVNDTKPKSSITTGIDRVEDSVSEDSGSEPSVLGTSKFALPASQEKAKSHEATKRKNIKDDHASSPKKNLKLAAHSSETEHSESLLSPSNKKKKKKVHEEILGLSTPLSQVSAAQVKSTAKKEKKKNKLKLNNSMGF